jgi:hypothetical protein
MKTNTLLMSTLLTAAAIFGSPDASIAQGNITTDTMKKPAVMPVKELDPRVAASSFVEHINYARVALAMKNPSLAKQHISEARNMITLIKNSATEQRLITSVESGRIVYKYDTEFKYHYFPVQTGPVEVKQLSNGPLWAKNDLAVTDADIVYLTLDLRGNKADNYLIEAEAAIAATNYRIADGRLAMLTQAVVTVDSKVALPLDKATDNIALSRHFMAAKNYEGAGFALKHADDALDVLEKLEGSPMRKADISMMRKEVSEMQAELTKKDPNLYEKVDAKMNKWWLDIKTWYNK